IVTSELLIKHQEITTFPPVIDTGRAVLHGVEASTCTRDHDRHGHVRLRVRLRKNLRKTCRDKQRFSLATSSPWLPDQAFPWRTRVDKRVAAQDLHRPARVFNKLCTDPPRQCLSRNRRRPPAAQREAVASVGQTDGISAGRDSAWSRRGCRTRTARGGSSSGTCPRRSWGPRR